MHNRNNGIQKYEIKEKFMVLLWSTKTRKEIKASSSTQRHSRHQRLGPAPWRSLCGSGSSLNLWDASSTTVLGFQLPLQEIRVKDAGLILVTIYFFLLREYYFTNQGRFVHVYALNMFYSGNFILL